jgi:hypothetical protein
MTPVRLADLEPVTRAIVAAALAAERAATHKAGGPAGVGRDVATGDGRDRSGTTPKVPARRRKAAA